MFLFFSNQINVWLGWHRIQILQVNKLSHEANGAGSETGFGAGCNSDDRGGDPSSCGNTLGSDLDSMADLSKGDELLQVGSWMNGLNNGV